MRSAPPLVVLLDEGAPIGLAQPFEARGHRVIRHGDVLAPGASDTLVAAQAALNGAALVATDRDMRQIAKRFGNAAHAPRFPGLHLIFIGCNAALAPKRVEHVMSLIELEWGVAHQKAARSLSIEVGPHHVRSNR